MSRKRSETIKKLLESSSSDEEEEEFHSPYKTKQKKISTPKSVPKINLKGRVVDVEESPIEIVQLMKSPRGDNSNEEILKGLKKISTPVNTKSPRMYTGF